MMNSRRYAQDTDVPVSKSKAEIESLLAKYGATSFMSGTNPDISIDDAKAEGVFVPEAQYAQQGAIAPILAFSGLWETINGPDSWDANPWVVAISFAPRALEA